MRFLSFFCIAISLPKRRTTKILDVTEMKQDLAALGLIDQTEELFPENLDVSLVQDLAVHEVNDQNIADDLNIQPGVRRRRAAR